MMDRGRLCWIHNTQTSQASGQFKKISLQVIDPCPSRTAAEREQQVQRPHQVGYDAIAPVGSNSYASQTQDWTK